MAFLRHRGVVRNQSQEMAKSGGVNAALDNSKAPGYAGRHGFLHL